MPKHGPGSTTGRPSQCRRAKVWATKKNPGIESSLWQTPCHALLRSRATSQSPCDDSISVDCAKFRRPTVALTLFNCCRRIGRTSLEVCALPLGKDDLLDRADEQIYSAIGPRVSIASGKPDRFRQARQRATCPRRPCILSAGSLTGAGHDGK
jgi:hypothetical protein